MPSKADAEQIIALTVLKRAQHEIESARNRVVKLHLSGILDVAHKTNAIIEHAANAVGEIREITESFGQS